LFFLLFFSISVFSQEITTNLTTLQAQRQDGKIVLLEGINSVKLRKDGSVFIIYEKGGASFKIDDIPTNFLNAWGINGTNLAEAKRLSARNERIASGLPVEEVKAAKKV